jgi:hypothetical protein
MYHDRIAQIAPQTLDRLLAGDSVDPGDALALVRLCLALNLVLWEAIDPHRLSWRDRERFEDDPSWQDGWDAAMDYVDRRIGELLSTDDEGRPWPRSGDSFRHEKDEVYRHRAESYRKL